jgi:hypothetical protein
MLASNPLRLLALPLIFACAMLAPSCGPAEPEGTEIGALTDEVLCANWASYALLKSLLGDHVPVHCLLAPAEANANAAGDGNANDANDDGGNFGDPTTFQPSREQLQRLQRARLVVLHGNQLEKWAERSNLAASRVMDCGIPLLGHLIMEEGKAHSHGAGGDHSHLEPNPYTWLSPLLVGKQADALAKSLQQTFPSHEGSIADAHRQLADQLAQLDQDYQSFAVTVKSAVEAGSGKDMHFPGSHPALLYLTKRYQLTFAGADDSAIDLLLQPSDRPLIDRLRGNFSHLQTLLP